MLYQLQCFIAPIEIIVCNKFERIGEAAVVVCFKYWLSQRNVTEENYKNIIITCASF
jgi:hypothetical protein